MGLSASIITFLALFGAATTTRYVEKKSVTAPVQNAAGQHFISTASNAHHHFFGDRVSMVMQDVVVSPSGESRASWLGSVGHIVKCVSEGHSVTYQENQDGGFEGRICAVGTPFRRMHRFDDHPTGEEIRQKADKFCLRDGAERTTTESKAWRVL